MQRGILLRHWTERDRLARRKRLFDFLTKKSIFEESFVTHDRHSWGEQEFNGIKIEGSIGFRSSREEFEDQLGIKLEGDLDFLKKLRPKEPRSVIGFEILLYLDGQPLDGWARGSINQITAEFESIGIPQILKGNYTGIGWAKVHENTTDFKIMEQQKQTLDLCREETDRLLFIIEGSLSDRQKSFRDR